MNSNSSNGSISLDKSLIQSKKSHLFGSKDFNQISEYLTTNFSFIQNWESDRQIKLSLHTSLMEGIMNAIDLKTNQSIEQFEFLMEFFKNKVLQYNKYVNHKFPSLKDCYKLIDTKREKKELNGCFHDQIICLDGFHNTLATRIKNFADLIDKKLLKSLSEDQRNFTSFINKERNRLLSVKKLVNKLTNESKEKFWVYTQNFEQTMKILNSLKSLAKPLYEYELGFLTVVYELLAVQKKMGLNLLAFLDEIKETEKKRRDTLLNILQRYAEEYRKCFTEEDNFVKVMSFFSEENPEKTIENNFSINELIKNEDFEMLAKGKDKNKGYLLIKEYFEGLELKEIEESELVFKRLSCSKLIKLYKNIGEDKKNESWKDCILIVTKDFYVLVIYDIEQKYSLPEVTIDLSKCSLKENTDDLIVEISEKRKGFCKSDLKHYFKFDSQSDREEIMSLVRK